MLIHATIIDDAVESHRLVHAQQHFDRLTDQAIEEMSELTKELLKLRRKKSAATADNIVSEMADVLICLEFIGRALAVAESGMISLVASRANRLSGELAAILAQRAEEKRLAERSAVEG